MKKFDLEKALAGEAVVTRDGREVTQLTKFDCDGNYPLCAVVDGKIISFTIDGTYLSKRGECLYDLFMTEPEMWMNVYWDHKISKANSIRCTYPSEKEAKANINIDTMRNYQTTIKLK
jgi:hypothetical protein